MGTDGDRLVTDHLRLRPVEVADVTRLAALWQDETVRRFLGGGVGPAVARARVAGLVGRPGCFAVSRRDEAEPIGVCLVQPGHGEPVELTYLFDPAVWGRGLASEAAARVVSYAFEQLGAQRVVAVTQAANLASIRLLERIGLRSVRGFVEFDEPQLLFARDAPGPPLTPG